MRPSRTHIVPVLAIVVGGVIGASLSFGLLGSRSEDVVFVAAPVVAPSATAEAARETNDQQLTDAARRLQDAVTEMRREARQRVQEALELQEEVRRRSR